MGLFIWLMNYVIVLYIPLYMMERLVKELVKTGNPRDEQYAYLVALIRNHRGADIPLSNEKNTETKRFSLEQKEVLEKEGYVIYELTGKSIKDLREKGKPFWSTWHSNYPDLENLRSRKSEVAVNPNQLFLPESNNKTFSEQNSLVAKFNKNILVKIPGVEAIIGEVPDYIELVSLSPTEHRLFGEDNRYCFTRTQTKVDLVVAYVGDSCPLYGIDVYPFSSDYRGHNLFVAPLLVPKGSK